ncbi:hypothetical protein CHS0354_042178 [Potamilus streckersoni]|uniref:FERM domain-containing protein n=1 Tax=Potamilus streckersoni TaxID=2493646 RepID=A0AAE0TM46_9BIVA|nr:hypothetical protein CHS0354_042178 [Potamilus streckersoni]
MESSQKAESTGRESSETAQKSPKKKRRFSFQKKMVVCRVTLLDGNTFEPKDIDKSADGHVLFDKVCRHLDLVESDYFGLSYRDDSGKRFWLDSSKKISKQVKGGTWVFEFNVKFYPPDPNGGFKEDLSRYLLCLQLRVDIFNGRLPCSFVTYALLGSYTVQSELGDFNPVEHGKTPDYLKDFDFAPSQTPELLEKIMELHKHHKGLTPSEADHNFLENAKKLAMYGVDLHEAKDSDRTDIMLGVCASGILVYKDKLRINRFVWPKILNLSYKRNNFYIKIRPGEFEPHEKTIGFKLENHKMAKRVWKTCVEHHAFFRLKEGEKASASTLFPRFNSKFRYSGRTQAQARKAAEMVNREQPHITRTAERRSLSYPENKAKSMDELAHRKNQLENNDDYYPDGKDKRDIKGVPTAITGMGPPPDSKLWHEDGKSKSAPGSGDGDAADRRDKLPGEGGDELATEQSKAGQLGSAELENKSKPGMKWALPGIKEFMEKQAAQEAGKKRHGSASSSSSSSSEDGEGKLKHKSAKDGPDMIVTVTPGFGDEDKKDGGPEIPSDDNTIAKTAELIVETVLQQALQEFKSGGSDKKDEIAEQELSPIDSSLEEIIPQEEDSLPVEGTSAPLGVEAETDVTVPDMTESQEDKKKLDSTSSSSSSVSSLDYGVDKSGEKLPEVERIAAAVNAEVEGDLAGGLGLKPGDYSSIDRKMEFIPLKPPNTTTKKSTSSEGEETMPFFNPAGEDGLEKQKKVPPPVAPKGIRKGYDSEEDRHMKTDSMIKDQTIFMPPTVPTESFKFNPDHEDIPVSTKNVPIVKTEKRTVIYEKDGIPVETEDSILISSSSHSTRSQTIETTTYKTEKDGVVETRVERKITVTSDDTNNLDDDDDLLAKAILEVTQMNKDMSVEKIDICRQIEEDGSTTVLCNDDAI